MGGGLLLPRGPRPRALGRVDLPQADHDAGMLVRAARLPAAAPPRVRAAGARRFGQVVTPRLPDARDDDGGLPPEDRRGVHRRAVDGAVAAGGRGGGDAALWAVGLHRGVHGLPRLLARPARDAPRRRGALRLGRRRRRRRRRAAANAAPPPAAGADGGAAGPRLRRRATSRTASCRRRAAGGAPSAAMHSRRSSGGRAGGRSPVGCSSGSRCCWCCLA